MSSVFLSDRVDRAVMIVLAFISTFTLGGLVGNLTKPNPPLPTKFEVTSDNLKGVFSIDATNIPTGSIPTWVPNPLAGKEYRWTGTKLEEVWCAEGTMANSSEGMKVCVDGKFAPLQQVHEGGIYMVYHGELLDYEPQRIEPFTFPNDWNSAYCYQFASKSFILCSEYKKGKK